MNKYSIIITLIAGMSTLIGYLFIYIKKDNNIIPKSLSFASGVMITLSFIDLIPTSISYFKHTIISFLLFIMSFLLGFYITYLLNKNIKEDKLYKTGLISMLGIIMHNIPEGIVTYIVAQSNIKLGILFSIALIFHNIPEGICISLPIYYSTNNKLKTFLYTFIAGISEFLGALLTSLFLYKYITNTILGILFSSISGIMIYISYFELFKSSLTYSIKITKVYFIIGVIFITISIILLKI